MKAPLLHEIEAFLSEYRMGASYFGVRACGNSHLVRRLNEGKSILVSTEARVRTFMAVYRHERSKQGAAA